MTPRRALLVTPSFFGYESDITTAMVQQGWSVDVVDERPANSATIRAIIRARPQALGRYIKRYYDSLLAGLAGKQYDLVLAIKGEVLPAWFIDALRAQLSDARFVFYTFDSISNVPQSRDLLGMFDKCFSFDRADSKSFEQLDYMPLFYGSTFSAPQSSTTRDLQMSFLGTLHSDRRRFVRTMMDGRDDTYSFLYMQARWYFAATKYLSREHSDVAWSEVSFKPLSRDGVASVFRRSKSVLDLQRNGQTGLTMRTFEVLASGAILITTNPAIEEEPFFDPSRVIVVSQDLGPADAAAVWSRLQEMPVPDAPPHGFDAYSLESWVRKVANS